MEIGVPALEIGLPAFVFIDAFVFMDAFVFIDAFIDFGLRCRAAFVFIDAFFVFVDACIDYTNLDQ